MRWDGTTGMALRPSGDLLFLHVKDVITEGVSTIKENTELYCRVTKPTSGKAWRAKEIEVCLRRQCRCTSGLTWPVRSSGG